MLHDTIAAIATPTGGGIGIVRISGPQSSAILRSVFSASKPDSFKNPAHTAHGTPLEFWRKSPCRLRRGWITEPGTHRILDEVLAVFMPGPCSYTGEDVVEIQGHGGISSLGSVLALVIQMGARLAQPGEFTRRAFLNGRMDLSQAESVLELVESREATSAAQALDRLGGSIKLHLGPVFSAARDALAEMEAFLDFGEDVQDMDIPRIALRLRENVLPQIRRLILRSRKFALSPKAPRIVVAGRPNVGKSSLVNALLGEERCIVHSSPGTTRDTVRAECVFSGAHVEMEDTAGIRVTEDPVEQQGVSRALASISRADLVVFVYDASTGLLPEDLEILGQVEHPSVVLAANKTDLLSGAPTPVSLSSRPWVPVSAKTRRGLDALESRVGERLKADIPSGEEETCVVNLRQRGHLEAALAFFEGAAIEGEGEGRVELMAEDMREGIRELQKIFGEGTDMGILDAIFGRFCIGK
jgi:tRNA modification GTPase